MERNNEDNCRDTGKMSYTEPSSIQGLPSSVICTGWQKLSASVHSLFYWSESCPWPFLGPLKIIYIHIGSKSYFFFNTELSETSTVHHGKKQRRRAGILGRCPILKLPPFKAYPTDIRTGWQKLFASVHSLFYWSISCQDIFEVNHTFFQYWTEQKLVCHGKKQQAGQGYQEDVLCWNFLRSRFIQQWSVLDGKNYSLLYTPSSTDPHPAWTFLWPLKISI